MKRLSWSEQAEADLEAIVEYIARENPMAAVRLGDDIVAQVARLKFYPLLGRIGRVAGTRELIMTHSPYLVIYTAEDDLRILRVLHGARLWPPKAS